MKKIMVLLAAAAMVVGLSACKVSSGASGSSYPKATVQKSYFDDPSILAKEFSDQLDKRYADSTDEIYSPGVTVTDSGCILETGHQFACYIKKSNGDSLSPVIVVNAAGDDWVSHAR